MGRYYSLNEYLQEQFGGKVYNLALDIGCTCPNRDGTLDTRGCIFCHNGSSHFAETGIDLNTQIENAKNRVKSKIKTEKYIAYFQSFTNTYGDIDYIEKQFRI
ncbi:MAG: TIGR01212 family radical SAM protein, partial [Clostridia bacterium]|nr:TIGR01212 family radical SAM protein [Clostridia bacterium]